MSKLKILVTGAAGMLGTALLDHLNQSFAIIATDIVRGYSPEAVQWHIVDLLDEVALRQLLEPVD